VNILPQVRAQVAALPVSARNGPGTLGDQLSQLEQLQHSPDPTITLAAPAGLPGGPYSPKTKLSLAAGLLGGLIIGVLAAFGFNALDPRLRRSEQLRELFDVPILATIPREPGRSGRRRARPLLPQELSFAGGEGYRTLRTILASSRTTKDSRAYLLTGASPAEGKTTSAISLAAAFAQGGSRVILVEADLRRPTIASTLAVDVEYGTEDVLIGAVDLADALISVRFGSVPIRVLAVRNPRADLADRLSTAIAERFMNQARAQADIVVIDSPPLTAVIDALPLAALADDVLVVTRVGHTRLAKLQELHNLLVNHHSYPSGLVVVGGTRVRSGYYNYYADELVAPADRTVANGQPEVGLGERPPSRRLTR
jgi:Mrp family chromosome partitioning ATPase